MMITTPSKNCFSNSQQGFTLLELLLVVLILSGVAWVTISSVENNSDQIHFEATKNRLKAIRYAIIGDSSRTINGKPDISGFVVDMGRLPNNMDELINLGSNPSYTYHSIEKIWAGWNGPYLDPTSLTQDGFMDGWGNDFIYSRVSGTLTVSSMGKGHADDDSVPPVDAYEADYTLPLVSADYRIFLTTTGKDTLAVDFGTPLPCWKCSTSSQTTGVYGTKSACESSGATWYSQYQYTDKAACTYNDTVTAPVNPNNNYGIWLPGVASADSTKICVVINYVSDGAVSQLVSEPSDFTWDGTRQFISFGFPDGTNLPMGKMSYGVFEYITSTSTCDTSKPFPSTATGWEQAEVVPRRVLQLQPRAIY